MKKIKARLGILTLIIGGGILTATIEASQLSPAPASSGSIEKHIPSVIVFNNGDQELGFGTRDFIGYAVPINEATKFRIVQGLADPSGVSIESVENPGYFLRHQHYMIKLHPYPEADELFKEDATFRLIRSGSAVSFQSYNYPNYAITVTKNNALWITPNPTDDRSTFLIRKAGAKVGVSKKFNLVLLNWFKDSEGNEKAITGIYAVPASAGGVEQDWGNNLISAPVAYGSYAALGLNTDKIAWYNIRVDFDGTDKQGKPLRYYHFSARLYEKGVIVHHAITSTAAGTSPWTISGRILPGFGKP